MDEAIATVTILRTLHVWIPARQETKPMQEESRRLQLCPSHCLQWSWSARASTLATAIPRMVAAATPKMVPAAAMKRTVAVRTALQATAAVQEQEEPRRESVGVTLALTVSEGGPCRNFRRCGGSITTRGNAWKSSVGASHAALAGVGYDPCRHPTSIGA